MTKTMAEKMKAEAVELQDGDIIVFDPSTKQYGRSEFDFCAKTIKGRIVEVHITRRQQVKEPSWFFIKLNADQFSVTQKGAGDPLRNNVAPWRYIACKDHRLSFSVYVPPGTNGLRVRKSCVNTRFEFE